MQQPKYTRILGEGATKLIYRSGPVYLRPSVFHRIDDKVKFASSNHLSFVLFNESIIKLDLFFKVIWVFRLTP